MLTELTICRYAACGSDDGFAQGVAIVNAKGLPTLCAGADFSGLTIKYDEVNSTDPEDIALQCRVLGVCEKV